MQTVKNLSGIKTAGGTGRDTPVMIAVISAFAMGIAVLVTPFIIVPGLQFRVDEYTFTVFTAEQALEDFNSTLLGREGADVIYSAAEASVIAGLMKAGTVFAVVDSLMLFAFAVFAYVKKIRALIFGRITLALTVVTGLWYFGITVYLNKVINDVYGYPNSITNLIYVSDVQLTGWPYALMAGAIALFAFLERMLNTRGSDDAGYYAPRSIRADFSLGKRTKASILIITVLIPAVIAFGIFFLRERSYYFISLCVVLLSMLPFFMVFEDRKPQAREVIIIAVLAAIAAVGRAAFFMLPGFKPVTALVIISAMGLGPEAGFLTGALSGFASNFFFGQGPWTPWQMFSFGIIGFITGLLFRGKRKGLRERRILCCTYGFLVTFFVYGTIMDFQSAISVSGEFSWQMVLAKQISGIGYNVVHGASTFIFLYLFQRPMLHKIERIRIKYGICEA